MTSTPTTPHGTDYRWDRHRPSCTGLTSKGTPCQGCGTSTPGRDQRREFAVRVTEALTGPADAAGYLRCPLTGERFHRSGGEVDRPWGGERYLPGNVALTSVNGNQGRASVQQGTSDLPGVERYRADVTRVSATLAAPLAPADASRVVSTYGKADQRAAVLAGPYGTP